MIALGDIITSRTNMEYLFIGLLLQYPSSNLRIVTGQQEMTNTKRQGNQNLETPTESY